MKKIAFKVYKEDDLIWPIDSFLILNSNSILPKNGDSRRVFAEQDYQSDREAVNKAKQKNKRELKVAIEDHINASL